MNQKLTLSLSHSQEGERSILVGALGSVQNSPNPRLDRWISEISQAYQYYHDANQRSEKAFNRLQRQIESLPIHEKLTKTYEFAQGAEEQERNKAESEFIKKLLEALSDRELSQAIFGPKASLAELKTSVQVWSYDINSAEKIIVNQQALSSLLRKLGAGLITNLDDFFDVIQIQGDLMDRGSLMDRSMIDAHGFSLIPGFSAHHEGIRDQTESFGDRDIGNSLPAIPVGQGDRFKFQATTLIPPLLRPLQTDFLKIPGRARLDTARHWTQISRSLKPGDLTPVPQSAEDWLILIPVVPSFAPGVKLPSFTLVPALGSLVATPISLIIMFSGTTPLSRHATLAEQVI